MRAAVFAQAVVLSACRAAPSDAPSPPPPASALATPSADLGAATTASGAARARLSPAPTITMACCTMDRAEGQFGTHGVVTRYRGDYLRRKDGERLFFPQDLINDTKELFQHAKTAGRSVQQERRVRAVGEGPRWVSLDVEERGETGALAEVVHSSCKTIDLRTGRALKLDDVVGKDAAAQAIASGEASFAELGGRADYRFSAASFAILGPSAKTVRFCNPRRREELAGARLDVEVTLP